MSSSSGGEQNHKIKWKYVPHIPKILYLFHPSLIFWSPPADIHSLRPHPGQIEVALRFRSLLDSDHHPSQIAGQRTNSDSKTDKQHNIIQKSRIVIVINLTSGQPCCLTARRSCFQTYLWLTGPQCVEFTYYSTPVIHLQGIYLPLPLITVLVLELEHCTAHG